jgi:hypothetical protein
MPRDHAFPDCPERDPEKLRLHQMEEVLRLSAKRFRAMGCEIMAKECEGLLQGDR